MATLQTDLRSWAGRCLWLVFGTFAALLVSRALRGEFAGPISIHSPLNVESFSTLSFLLLLLLKSGQTGQGRAGVSAQRRGVALVVLASIVGLCVGAFSHSLAAPFLFDDYGHIQLAKHAGLWHFVQDFYRPHQDIFFRPIGFLTFAFDVRWADYDPFRWHCTSLVLHILNSCLVFAVVRRLGLSSFPAALAAAVFAVHGSRVEAVCWTDARFDLLATFFVLLAIASVQRYAIATRGRWWLCLACFFSLCGLLAKEAALCLPFIVLAIALFYRKPERVRLWKAVPLFFGVCVLEFVYRLWIIGGVGGYQSGGHADVLAFSVLRFAKALLWRVWALLFFPLNWPHAASISMGLALMLCLLSMAYVAARVRVDRRYLGASLLVVIAASLPVQHLLLLEADLAGARLLYLPVVGVALVWAVVAEQFTGKPLRWALAAAVLGFQLYCLEWNMTIWTEVARTARDACRDFGQAIAALPGPVEASNLPVKCRGVFFLSDAFPDCVEMNTGVAASRILVTNGSGGQAKSARARFRWNEKAMRFEQEVVKPK